MSKHRNLQTYLWSVESALRDPSPQAGVLMGSVPPVLCRNRAHAQRQRQLLQPAGRTDARSSAPSRCRQGWLEEGGGATSEEAVARFTSFQTFRKKKKKKPKKQLFSHTLDNLNRSHLSKVFWLLFVITCPVKSTRGQTLIYSYKNWFMSRYFTAHNYSYDHAETTKNDWWLPSELSFPHLHTSISFHL